MSTTEKPGILPEDVRAALEKNGIDPTLVLVFDKISKPTYFLPEEILAYPVSDPELKLSELQSFYYLSYCTPCINHKICCTYRTPIGEFTFCYPC